MHPRRRSDWLVVLLTLFALLSATVATAILPLPVP